MRIGMQNIPSAFLADGLFRPGYLNYPSPSLGERAGIPQQLNDDGWLTRFTI
jgi:hypothetical protein